MAVQTTYSDAPSAAYPGMLAGNEHTIVAMKQAEASAEIPFGYGVVYDPSSPESDQSATLPAAETNKVWGIVVHSHNYQRTYTLADGTTAGDLGTSGLRPGVMMNVLRKGRIWVTAEDACVPGDRLWVRCTVGGAGEVVGGLTNADESTETIDCTAQGVWCTTAAAGGLAILEVDFTNKP